jgi:hypothetical protein
MAKAAPKTAPKKDMPKAAPKAAPKKDMPKPKKGY